LSVSPPLGELVGDDELPPTSGATPKSPPRTRPHRAIPTRCRGYLEEHYGERIQVLGTGTGGVVHLYEVGDGFKLQHLAVKAYLPDTAADAGADAAPSSPTRRPDGFFRRLRDESMIALSMRHPNLIRTLDFFMEQGTGTYYSVMEYCPRDLFTLVQAGMLSRPEIDCYFAQIVRGVAYMHSVGVAHRDLKLDNVCVSDGGIAKIIDFGCATIFRVPQRPPPRRPTMARSRAISSVGPEYLPTPTSPKYDESERPMSATFKPVSRQRSIEYATGMCGSDPYISPEVFVKDQMYDPRKADVWAIAVIYLSMISYHFPWEIAKTSDPNYEIFVRQPRAVVEYWLAEHREAAALIYRMLSTDPARRPTIEQVMRDPWFQSIQVCGPPQTPRTASARSSYWVPPVPHRHHFPPCE
jgi:serine/threonine protein kinase